MLFSTGVLISTCQREVQPDHTMQLLKVMRPQGLLQNVIADSALISVCVKREQPENGLLFSEAMQQL